MSVDFHPAQHRARRLVIAAVVVSLGVHAALLPPAARWLEREPSASEEEVSMTSEVLLPMAEWVVMEAAPEVIVQEPAEVNEESVPEEEELGFVRTTANQASLTSPEQPSFVSDRNTLARSARPGDGTDALPNLAGERTDSLEIEDRRYRDGRPLDESPTEDREPTTPGALSSAAQPPVVEPREQAELQARTSTEISEPLPEIVDAIPLPNSSTLLHNEVLEGEEERLPKEHADEDEEDTEDAQEELETPVAAVAVAPGAPTVPVTPAPSTLPVPERAEEAFQSETRRAQLDGQASEAGYPSYDAEDTPIGRYRKEISTAIERSWQARMLESQDFFGFNVRIRVEFTVNRWGAVNNLRVPVRAKNAILTNQTLAAIMDADLPEMPPAVVKDLGGGELPCFFNFNIH